MPQRTRLASAALLAGALCLLTACQRPPFSDKINAVKLTLSLDNVPGCAFENREHVLQWNARRLMAK